MTSEDFSAWLSAMSLLSEGQRAEAMAALEKAGVTAGEAEASAKKAGRRSRREDALGTTGVERVERQGCPHCAGRGSSAGAVGRAVAVPLQELWPHVQRPDQTPMAHLREKEQVARSRPGDDRGQEPGQTVVMGGVDPTTAFRWRHRFCARPPTTSLQH